MQINVVVVVVVKAEHHFSKPKHYKLIRNDSSDLYLAKFIPLKTLPDFSPSEGNLSINNLESVNILNNLEDTSFIGQV